VELPKNRGTSKKIVFRLQSRHYASMFTYRCREANGHKIEQTQFFYKMNFKNLPAHLMLWSLAVTLGRGQQDFSYNITRITSEGGRDYGEFGLNIAISGNTLAATSRVLPEADSTCGGDAVFIFVKGDNGWEEQARLTEEVVCEHEDFGKELSLDGDTLVVGAPGGTSFADGAAFVFERSNEIWSLIKTLKPPADEYAWRQYYGSAVAVSDGRVAVGAPVGAQDKDTVFVYSNGQWDSPQRLVPSDPINSDWGVLFPAFGSNGLSFDGDLLVAADMGKGAAYAFADDGSGLFVELKQIVLESGEFLDFFGSDVIVDGGFIAVPSHAANDREGKISVFSSEEPYPLLQTLRPNLAYGEQGSFGWKIDMVDGRIVATANASPTWYLYVYDWDASTGAFVETAVLRQLEDEDTDGRISYSSLALTATSIAIGDYLDSELGSRFGAVVMLEVLLEGEVPVEPTPPTSLRPSMAPTVAPTGSPTEDTSSSDDSLRNSLVSVGAVGFALVASFLV
jgi:hypothetical protein